MKATGWTAPGAMTGRAAYAKELQALANDEVPEPPCLDAQPMALQGPSFAFPSAEVARKKIE
ncbi:hypothetical protein NKI12_23675 [Mesorhizobium australicum]|uniref:Uncharacterized protein n=1 Tax=Mesorhizobium australicum TaxID=536018 RepID=A0ACC6T372_9HYPH|nr:hypothetical protein [Mesorhizobium sp. LNHC229A00]